MSYLGNSFVIGRLDQGNKVAAGNWTCTFTADDMPNEQEYEVWHGFTVGPGGYFLVYIDTAGYGVGQNGRINEYSPSGGAMFVRKGQIITLNWSIATGAAPIAWLYYRTPEVGRI